MRVVVAPDPFYRSDAAGALLEAAKHQGNPTSFGHAYVRNVTAPDGHLIFTAVYQTLIATDYYVGGQSDRPLFDRGGRPIDLTEGLVLRPEIEYTSVTGSALYAAHLAVVPDYASYWHKPSESFLAISNALRWNIAEADSAIQFHVLEPVALRVRPISWPDGTRRDNRWRRHLRPIQQRTFPMADIPNLRCLRASTMRRFSQSLVARGKIKRMWVGL